MTKIDVRNARLFALVVAMTTFFLMPVQSWAQDEAEAEVDSTAWQKSMSALLAGSQASYDNWAEGGINSLAFTASINGTAERNNLNWIQKHELRLALGSLKQDTLEFRKADDLIQYNGTWQYQNDDNFARWHPTGALEFRTQFANGFDYGGTSPVKVSAMFSPAIVTETLGFSYNPEDWFSWLIGIAGKQTIVGIEELRPNYGNELDESLRFESGFNTKATVDRDIFENVHLKTGLSVFGAFNNLGNPDIRWENLITMTVNSWLSVGFEFVTFYDKDISSDLQIKQVLSTGVTVALL